MFFLTMHVHGQKVPAIYKELIAEAYYLSGELGDDLFPGFTDVPFTTLLITDSAEFLFFHPNPSSDFLQTGDSLLSHPIFVRGVKLNKFLLATFPAVNGVSCIVTGTPENTGTSAPAWIISLLHEHFHQYQQSQPGYYRAAEVLNLSHGDKTGMWMLNYPFPYESKELEMVYTGFTHALHAAVEKLGKKRFDRFFDKYLSKRKQLKKLLPENDYKYLSLQIWQEGISRYAEYSLLGRIILKDSIMLVSKFRQQYEQLFTNIRKTELRNLKKLTLKNVKRIHFYSVGFAEGILLDAINPTWRQHYNEHPFSIDHLLAPDKR